MPDEVGLSLVRTARSLTQRLLCDGRILDSRHGHRLIALLRAPATFAPNGRFSRCSRPHKPNGTDYTVSKIPEPTIPLKKLLARPFGKFIAVAVLVIGAIAWSNWYFLPEKRLERLVKSAAGRYDPDLTAAHNQMWTSNIKPHVGGGEVIGSAFCTIGSCYASLSKLFPRSNGTYIDFSAELRVEPVLIPPSYPILPAEVRFKPEALHWAVRHYAGTGDGLAGEPIFGEYNDAELTALNAVFESTGPANYLRALGKQLLEAVEVP